MKNLRMKYRIKSLISMTGLEVRPLRGVPFGVYWELDARRLLDNRSGPVTLFDVGANAGQTALALANAMPNSKIYSFEPVPVTFAKLKRTTAHLAQVECIKLALGDNQGEAVITSDRDGQNTLLSGVRSNESVLTKVSTIDDFCAESHIQHINLLKIDTEGFESFVLKGASEMLANGNVDIVVAECDFNRTPDENPHGNFFEIYSMLTQLGFTIVSLYTDGIDQHGWLWGNMLMMREGLADGIKVLCSPNIR